MSHQDTNCDMFNESEEEQNSEEQWDMERELRGE